MVLFVAVLQTTYSMFILAIEIYPLKLYLGFLKNGKRIIVFVQSSSISSHINF